MEDKVETTGPAAVLGLAADRAEINGDGEDVAMVTVSVVDEQGRKVPTANNNVVFFAIKRAGGRIIGVGQREPIIA